MSKPRIYADFNRIDEHGWVLLDRRGTIDDLNKFGVELREGLQLTLYMDDADSFGNPDDLEIDAEVCLNKRLNIWAGRFDPEAFRHASERR
jgi:hypothetical protein